MTKPADNAPLTEWALYWASAGIPVFPCNADKAPLTKNGFHDAVTDPAAVAKLFKSFGPSAVMIGGRMGEEAGVFAVDVDLYKGDAPLNWYNAAFEDGTLVPTREHKTKSGGRHLLYASSDGKYPNQMPTAGVEVKGEGGYIILPGTPGYEVVREGVEDAPTKLNEFLAKATRATQGSTLAALEHNVLSGEDFHNSITRIVAKMASQNKSALVIQKHVLDLLEASVARAPNHERHDRWISIIEDRGGELSRMVGTGVNKFNDDALAEEFEELAPFDEMNALVGTLFHDAGDHQGLPAPLEPFYSPDEWPFAGHGYFAHEEINLQSQSYAMFPIYAENETCVIFAEPKTGKTAIALTTALCIACGFDYGQFKVAEAGTVLYYALEGKRAIELRVAAWKREMLEQKIELPADIRCFVVDRAVNFLKEDQQKASVSQIVAANKYEVKNGRKPIKVIFIDTLTKAMAGGDQNSVDDTSQLFELVGALRKEGVTATIVFVHHKARTGGVRGSTNIEAEPDILLDVSKKGDNVMMKIARARSIEDGGKYFFKLKGHNLGETPQGHPLQGVVALAVAGGEVGEDFNEMEEHTTVENLNQLRQIVTKLGAGEHPMKSIVYAWNAAGLLPSDAKPIASDGWVQKAALSVAPPAGANFSGMNLSAKSSYNSVRAILVRALV
jgi:hypothetical protein